MKKITYIFLLIFSLLTLSNVYAVENYTAPQDIGVTTNQDGSVTIPNTDNSKGNQITKSTKEVADKGMDALDQITATLLNDIDNQIKTKVQKYYQQVTSAIVPIFGAFIVFWLIFNGVRMGMGL